MSDQPPLRATAPETSTYEPSEDVVTKHDKWCWAPRGWACTCEQPPQPHTDAATSAVAAELLDRLAGDEAPVREALDVDGES